MPSEIPPITFGTFFHIYNRGNNRENIFIQERNYAYFMQLWWKHTSEIFDTWAYCCLRNHFHVAGYVKDEKDLSGLKRPSQYFSNYFNAYSRGVNLAVGRTGALFARPFKRIPVTSEAYLRRLIVYIHQNPQKHGFESNFQDWKYSSYQELTSSIPTCLHRGKVWDLFGSREDFIRIHQEIQPRTDFEED